MVVVLEYTERINLHSALPYILVGAISSIVFTIGSRVTGMKFAATAIAAFYMLFNMALIWILPLFPAQPKLGPVYQNVTHFIPMEFPLLLIGPAFLLDLFWQEARKWNLWAVAAASAVICVGSLVALEWPFANFLMSPASRNAFFGTMYFYYGLPPTSFTARHQFYPWEGIGSFVVGFVIALVLATLTIRWAFVRGDWFRSIQR
jgi:hypothetical protein